MKHARSASSELAGWDFKLELLKLCDKVNPQIDYMKEQENKRENCGG